MESNNNSFSEEADPTPQQEMSDYEFALNLSMNLNQPYVELCETTAQPSSSSSSFFNPGPSYSQDTFIDSPISSLQHDSTVTAPSYRESSPSYSVSTFQTQTTTSSITKNFKGKATITDLEKIVEDHNESNKDSVKTIIKNKNKKTARDPDEIIVETAVPWSGNELINKQFKSNTSWIFKLGFGIRVGDIIYCTYNRKDKRGCFKKFTSKDMSSSTFTRHLKVDHKIVQESLLPAFQALSNHQKAFKNCNPQVNTKDPIFIHNYLMKHFKKEKDIKQLTNYFPPQQAENSFTNQTTALLFNKQNFYKLLADMILQNHLPYSFVTKNHSFQNLLNFVCNSSSSQDLSIIDLPARSTITRFIESYYITTKQKIIKILQKQESLCFTTDVWTAEGGVSYMSLTAHYIDKNTWKPKQITIGFEDLSGLMHNGQTLGKVLIAILDDYQITPLLFCVTSDNASNNTKMGEYIEQISKERKAFKFIAKENMIHCTAHVLNLACQDLINKGIKSNAPPEADLFTVANDLLIQEANEPAAPTTNVVNRLRKGVIKIKSVNELNDQFVKYRDDFLKAPKLVLKYDCCTRWNSTYDMIQRYILLHESYNHALSSSSAAATKHKTHQYLISTKEKDFLKRLCDLLSVFYTGTIWLCAQRYTTISRTVSLYNTIFDTLDLFEKNDDPENADLKNAASFAYIKLSKYYGKTDLTDVYTCATALDPELKFENWEIEEWEEDIIEKQKKIVEDSWKSYLYNYYEEEITKKLNYTLQQLPASTISNITEPTTTTADTTTTTTTTTGSFMMSSKRKAYLAEKEKQKKKRITAPDAPQNIVEIIEEKIKSNKEFQEYITEEITYNSDLISVVPDTTPESNNNNIQEENEAENDLNMISEEGFINNNNNNNNIIYDSDERTEIYTPANNNIYYIKKQELESQSAYSTGPLEYWKKNEYRFPILSKFARKYLAVCASSVPSERLFSRAKRIVNHQRASLTSNNAKMNILLTCWESELNVENDDAL